MELGLFGGVTLNEFFANIFCKLWRQHQMPSSRKVKLKSFLASPRKESYTSDYRKLNLWTKSTEILTFNNQWEKLLHIRN